MFLEFNYLRSLVFFY